MSPYDAQMSDKIRVTRKGNAEIDSSVYTRFSRRFPVLKPALQDIPICMFDA